MQIISAKSLSEQMQAGRVELIDVRTPMEYQEVHIEGAKNIPLDTLNVDDFIASRDESCIDSLCMICRSGVRGGKACEKLASAGLQRVFNLDGGMLAWEALELDVIRGRKVMSLERQVRIAAGFLVLAGAVLGHFVHQGFFGVSAFVGAGLIFAGITDSCAMGMLIAKMPWNQE